MGPWGPELRGGAVKLQTRLAVIAGIMALCAPPAVAFGAPGAHPKHPTTHPGTKQAKVYGKLCQGESKKHVAGQRGTPYGVCVSGAKKLLRQHAGG